MKSLTLVVLRCRDLERSRTFYEAFTLRFAKHAHGSGPEHYAHEDARGVFELYPAKDSAAGNDMTSLGFGVTDMDGIRAALSAAGFEPGEARDTPWGRTFVVPDPDGRRVEVKAV